MKIKKMLSALIAGVMLVTAFTLPASAADTLTFSPGSASTTYRLKVTASTAITPTAFSITDSLSITSNALAGASVTVSSPGKSNYAATVLGGDFTPTLNNSRISSTSLTFGFSSGTVNTVVGGSINKFSWVGYIELSDNTKHPVNDLGLNLSQLTFGSEIVVTVPYAGSNVPISLTETIVGEVTTPTANTKTFASNTQINVTDCFGNGRGLTLTQQSEIKKSTSKNFTVTVNLDKSLAEDITFFTFTTNLVSTTIPATVTKGSNVVKFTVPKEYFYEGVNYDELFKWIKVVSPNNAYNFTSIIVEYDAATGTSASSGSSDDETEEEFTINYSSVTLNTGASANLKTSYEDVTWRTSSSATVRVFTNGKITAVKTGTATITGTNENGDTVKCKVTVISSKTPVTSINFSKKSGTAYINSSYDIGKMMTANPSKHTDKITWSSSNPDVATVSSSGKVKVLDSGDVTITATASSGKSTSILLKCKKPSVKLSKSSATISEGKTTTIGATSLPSSSKITYESYNEGVATVSSSGVVTGIKAGTAKIIVRNKNGGSATFTVTVK